MGSPDFISCVFNIESSDEISEDLPVGFLKVVSLGLSDITMLCLAYSSKIIEDIGCMEVTSLGVSKISIKGVTEETILGRNKVCDEYIPLGMSE